MKIVMFLSLFIVSVVAMADDVMTKKGDTIVVNTTTLCDAKGYKGTTPVEVYFLKGRIVKIVPLKNMESKNFFKRVVSGYLPQFKNLKVAKAKKLASQDAVDGVTGATFSAKALQSNIFCAIKYYEGKK